MGFSKPKMCAILEVLCKVFLAGLEFCTLRIFRGLFLTCYGNFRTPVKKPWECEFWDVIFGVFQTKNVCNFRTFVKGILAGFKVIIFGCLFSTCYG